MNQNNKSLNLSMYTRSDLAVALLKLSSDVFLDTAKVCKKKRAFQDSSTIQQVGKRTFSSSPPSQSQKRRRLVTYQYIDSEVKPGLIGYENCEMNDVLSGRGGGTNQHAGNRYFRSLIDENREKYLRAKKNDKPFISLSIVDAIRRRNGRFLKKDKNSGLWYEIGDAAAREKTSQAFRQNAQDYMELLSGKESQSLWASSHQRIQSPVSTTPKAFFDINAIPSMTRAMGALPPYPNDDVSRLLKLSVSLQQIHLQKAAEALRLQRKLDSIKLVELLLKSSR